MLYCSVSSFAQSTILLAAGSGGGGGGTAPTKQTTNACSGFGSPITCSYGTITAGWTLQYTTASSASGAVFTVSDSQTNSYTTDGSVSAPGGIVGTGQTGHATAGSTGSITLTISWTGGGDGQVTIASLSGSSGLDQVATLNGQIVPGTGANVVTSNAVTTLHTDLCIGYSVDAAANGGTVASGTSTVVWNIGSATTSFGQGNEYFAQSAAGSITATFSNSATFAQTITGISCFKP